MILKKEAEDTTTFVVYDADGNIFNWVYEYNTEEQTVSLMIPLRSKFPANFLPIPMHIKTAGDEIAPGVVEIWAPGSYAKDSKGNLVK